MLIHQFYLFRIHTTYFSYYLVPHTTYRQLVINADSPLWYYDGKKQEWNWPPKYIVCSSIVYHIIIISIVRIVLQRDSVILLLWCKKTTILLLIVNIILLLFYTTFTHHSLFSNERRTVLPTQASFCLSPNQHHSPHRLRISSGWQYASCGSRQKICGTPRHIFDTSDYNVNSADPFGRRPMFSRSNGNRGS